MELPTLETLKCNYPTSSWAYWSQNFPDEGCIEEDSAEFYKFIQRNQKQLRPSIVLLSLNPSTTLPANYQNFHSTDPKHRNDQFRDHVVAADLEGAYMTDLVERVVEANSAKVEPTSADVSNLLEQLDLLNQERYYLICFHLKVFQTLMDAFNSTSREHPHDIKGFSTVEDGRQLECYRVWFHANWGANKDKIPALREQLKFLSAEIINGGRTDLSRWVD